MMIGRKGRKLLVMLNRKNIMNPLLILCFINYVYSLNCHPMEESLFIFDKRETYTTFQFYAVRHAEMSFGFGFSPTLEVSKNSFMLWYESPTSFFELKNHTKKHSKMEFFFHFKPEITENSIIDQYHYFTFKVNNTHLNDQKFIFFSSHQIGANFNSTTESIPRHQHVSIYQKSLLNTTEIIENCGAEQLQPYRFFMNALPPLGLIRFIFSLLLFIVLVFYRNNQPLKSRNYAPHYTCIVQMIEFMVVSLRGYAGITFEVKYQCLMNALVSFPSLYMLSVIIFSFYSRYLIINNLSQQKKVYANGKLPLIYVLLGGFDKFSFFTILPIFAYVYMLILQLIIIGVVDPTFSRCSILLGRIMLMVQLMHLGFNCFLAFICGVFDFISNVKLLIRCQLKVLFIDRDPFRIRLELFLFMAIAAFYFSVFLPMVFFDFPQMISQQLIDLGLMTFFFVNGVIPLLLTIWRQMKRICNKQSKIEQNDIDVTLQNPGFLQAFITFSEKEYSPENILFRLDHQEYKKSSLNARNEIVATMDQKYLHSTSPYEINIDGRSLSRFKVKLERCRKDGKYYDDLFDEIERSVNTNLSDTYGRFIYSDEYKNAVAKASLLGKGFVRTKNGTVIE